LQPRELLIRQVTYNYVGQYLDMRTHPVLDQEMPRMRSPTDVHQMLSQRYGEELIVGRVPLDLPYG
jgi:hypothetical protein